MQDADTAVARITKYDDGISPICLVCLAGGPVAQTNKLIVPLLGLSITIGSKGNCDLRVYNPDRPSATIQCRPDKSCRGVIIDSFDGAKGTVWLMDDDLENKRELVEGESLPLGSIVRFGESNICILTAAWLNKKADESVIQGGAKESEVSPLSLDSEQKILSKNDEDFNKQSDLAGKDQIVPEVSRADAFEKQHTLVDEEIKKSPQTHELKSKNSSETLFTIRNSDYDVHKKNHDSVDQNQRDLSNNNEENLKTHNNALSNKETHDVSQLSASQINTKSSQQKRENPREVKESYNRSNNIGVILFFLAVFFILFLLIVSYITVFYLDKNTKQNNDEASNKDEVYIAIDKSPFNEKEFAHFQYVFKQMSKARELSAKLELNLGTDGLFVTGAIEPSKVAILERMLLRFATLHNLSSPVLNKTTNPLKQLPFDIIQITSGANGNITLSDGKVLYVGDEHQGYRLISITNHELFLGGENPVKMAW